MILLYWYYQRHLISHLAIDAKEGLTVAYNSDSPLEDQNQKEGHKTFSVQLEIII